MGVSVVEAVVAEGKGSVAVAMGVSVVEAVVAEGKGSAVGGGVGVSSIGTMGIGESAVVISKGVQGESTLGGKVGGLSGGDRGGLGRGDGAIRVSHKRHRGRSRSDASEENQELHV